MKPKNEYDSGVLHMEQVSPKEEALGLGCFFGVWNRTFNSTCIFEYCSNATHGMKMWVNGKRSLDFENLTMRDGDLILIVYSKSYDMISRF